MCDNLEEMKVRTEMAEKANLNEVIEALYGALHETTYAELNRIEDEIPYFERPENAQYLEFTVTFGLALKTIAHILKGKDKESQAAVADLLMNDISDMIGLPMPTDEDIQH